MTAYIETSGEQPELGRLERLTSYPALSEVLSQYFRDAKVVVTARTVKQFNAGFGKSSLYIISDIRYENQNQSPLPRNLLLKIYPEEFVRKTTDTNLSSSAVEEYELERTFLHYVDENEGFAKATNGEVRAFQRYFSFADDEYVGALALLSDLPRKQNLGDQVKSARKGDKEGIEQMAIGALRPLVLLHERADIEVAHELGLSTRSAQHYKDKFVGFLSTLVEVLELDEGKFEKLRPYIEENYLILARHLADIEGLDRVIHGDLLPHNHLGASMPGEEMGSSSLVDGGNVRIGPLTLDIGYLGGSPIFSEETLSLMSQQLPKISKKLSLDGNEIEKFSRIASFHGRIREATATAYTIREFYEENIGASRQIRDSLEGFVRLSTIPQDFERAKREAKILIGKNLVEGEDAKAIENLKRILTEIGIFS